LHAHREKFASNKLAGPVLSLLHPYRHHARHRPRHNIVSETEQRCASRLYFTVGLLSILVELENTGARIESDFTPEHADLIQGQRKKQKRMERRIKRGLVMLGGWALNAAMVYLILVTATTTPDIWDPYAILGVSRVRVFCPALCVLNNYTDPQHRVQMRRQSRSTTENSLLACTLIKPTRTPRRTLPCKP
jgi:hypothetical protein